MVASRRRRADGGTTIHDVAAAVGVSTMTVSRVINGETNVNAATRHRVAAAIAALNYAPNPAAQSLAGAARIRLGLLYSNPSAAYLGEFLLGSLDAGSRSGVGVVVEKCDTTAEACSALRRLIADGVDGIVLPPPLSDLTAVVQLVVDTGIPAVAVGSGEVAAPLSLVGIDDAAAAAAMTTYLLALGHHRIGFIAGDTATTVSAARLSGHRAALAATQISVDPNLVAYGDYTYRSGLAATEALLAWSPTAIFASNDDMAAAAIAVAHRHGLDVPGDLSVVGFDDTPIATTVWPALTTIVQPIAAMARAAVAAVVDEVRARRRGTPLPPRCVRLDHGFVIRESAAPPRYVTAAVLGRGTSE